MCIRDRYYSLCLTAFSIYSVNNSTTKLSIVLTIASVLVTVSIVFLSTKRYGERSKELKNNYLELDRLYRKLSIVDTTEKLDDFSEQYTNLLNSSENHSEYDYYLAILQMKDEKETLNKKEIQTFYLIKISRFILSVILLLIPFFLKYVADVIGWIVNM